MSKETNLDNIKATAKHFLHVDIAETSTPFVASHPFANTWFAALPDGEGAPEMVDLHDPDAARKWRDLIGKQIDKCDLRGIFVMINKPYILNFLKFVADDMSERDLGVILNACWQSIEVISLDVSITGKELVRLFKRADKETLMGEKERSFYHSLPEQVTVYRGVTSYNKSKKEALSWTVDKNMAKWFANRFDTGTGEVWTLTVPKERILCAFSGREKELIVDLNGYKNEISVEKV